MKRKLILILSVLLLITGALVVVFPHINNIIYSKKAEKNIEEFLNLQSASNSETQKNYHELYEELQNYNEQLFLQDSPRLTNKSAYENFSVDLSKYSIKNDLIGYISIPKMKLKLPLFLGADKINMAEGIAVMGQTSAPIGGENTNCCLAGHRGWNGTKKFRYIEKLQKDDKIYITNLWDKLTYKVIDIKIIEKYNADSVKIIEGKDIVTLLTCHPYGSVGEKRYMVVCQRVEK